MSLFTISQLSEGDLASWAGLHKTLEDAKAFVAKERLEEMDEAEIAELGEPDALVWEKYGESKIAAWHRAYDRDSCVLYEIVEHKQC